MSVPCYRHGRKVCPCWGRYGSLRRSRSRASTLHIILGQLSCKDITRKIRRTICDRAIPRGTKRRINQQSGIFESRLTPQETTSQSQRHPIVQRNIHRKASSFRIICICVNSDRRKESRCDVVVGQKCRELGLP